MSQEPTPERTALYRLYDADDRLLYVGISNNPGRRFRQHAIDKAWWPEVRRRELEWHRHSNAAYAAETQAIKSEGPRYNILGTQEHNARQSKKHRANADQQRIKGRVAQEAYRLRMKVGKAMEEQGCSWDEAMAEGKRAEQAHKDKSGAFRCCPSRDSRAHLPPTI